MSLADKADVFLRLHVPGKPAVLPTVWDPWSAKLVEEAGFAALTIGSDPLAEALGSSDGEHLPLTEVLAQVRRIADAVEIPVSADLESGFGASPGELVDRLLEAGAVGVNIEDTVHSEGERLRSTQEHADYIAGLRQAADEAGVHVVVNARTDILLEEVGLEPDRVERAIAKLVATAEAGADVLYPCGILTDDVHQRLADGLPLPVNALARPRVDDLRHLAGLGVGRISFGPFLQTALAAETAEILANWK